MKEKKPTTQFRQEEQTYQTGSVTPPKNYGGIIAFLLVLVIFLCGITTALGLMNIHLFRQLTSAETPSETCAVAFAEAPEMKSSMENDALVHFSLGFSGQAVPDFWQYYRDLPQGIYITEVDNTGAAAAGGLLSADVLTHFDGIPVPNTDVLLSVLESCISGQKVDVDICRNGEELTFTLIVD